MTTQSAIVPGVNDPTDICNNCRMIRAEHHWLQGALNCPKGGGRFFQPPISINAWNKTIADILDWQRYQFPTATTESSLKHLRKECDEIAQFPRNITEWADAFFMVLQGADRTGQDLLIAVRDKLGINRFERTWQAPDEEGVQHHVVKEGNCHHDKIAEACEICNSTGELTPPLEFKGDQTSGEDVPEIPIGLTDAAEEFHAHLDVCEQCEKHPFDLCRVGAALVQKAAGGFAP